MHNSTFLAPARPARRISLFLVCLAALVLAIPPAAPAQEPGSAEFGFEQRVRNENWNNLFDFNGKSNDEREQIRYRTRVWTRLPLASFIDLNLGLNSEINQRMSQKNGFDEVVFETANLNIRKLFVRGLSLKVGRQDITRGEGLILLEGTPGDGSRSTYFNGFDLAYAYRKSTIEAIGILNPHSDQYLPRIHDRDKMLTDWDEQAIGLYYTDRNLANTSVDAYYFHKKETGDRLAPTNPQYQPDRRIETAGARMVHRFDKRWSVTAEGAKQWGAQHPTTPISAWAGYGYVKRTFETRWAPYLLGGFWALSGDDPSRKDRVMGWDPLFSRWPKWGDLELYAQVPEKGVGYATNQKRLQVEAGASTPGKRFSGRFTYYHLTAFHPFAGSPKIFGTGTDRGDNFQARLDYAIRPELKGHIVYETLAPGSFYANRGRAYFLRFEVIAQVKSVVPEFHHRLISR